MFLRSENQDINFQTVTIQNFYGLKYEKYIYDRNRIKFLRLLTIKMKSEP